MWVGYYPKIEEIIKIGGIEHNGRWDSHDPRET